MTKYLVARWSLGRGICTVGDSLWRRLGDLQLMHLILVTRRPILMTKALAVHGDRLEGSICGLTINHSEEDILDRS